MADYRCCVGSFIQQTALGWQTITGIADEFGSFTPKFILFWSTGRSGTGVFWENGSLSICGSDMNCPSQEARGWQSYAFACLNTFFPTYNPWLPSAYINPGSPGNVDTVVTVNNTALCAAPPPPPTAPGAFSLNWAVNNGRAAVWNYLAVGGADFQRKIGNTLFRNTTGVPVPVAITGIGFQPKGLMVSSTISTGSQCYIPGAPHDELPAWGWTDGTNQGAACGSGFDDPHVSQEQRTDLCGVAHSCVNIHQAYYGVTSFDPDGFTLTSTHADDGPFWNPPFDGNGFQYFAFGGALPCACGSFNLSGGSQSVSLSGKPGAVLFMTSGVGSGFGLLQGHRYFSYGAADALGNQRSTFSGTRIAGDGRAINTAAVNDSTRAITCVTIGLGIMDPSPTVTATAEVELTNTGFTVNQLTGSGGEEILWFAFGVEAVEPPIPPPPTPSICEVGHGTCEPTLGAARTGV